MTELNYDINRSAYGGSNNRRYRNKGLRILMWLRFCGLFDCIFLPCRGHNFTTTISLRVALVAVFARCQFCHSWIFLASTSSWIAVVAFFTFWNWDDWGFDAITCGWINDFPFFAALKFLKNIYRARCNRIALSSAIIKSCVRYATFLLFAIASGRNKIIIHIKNRYDDIFGWVFREQ